MSGCCVGGGSAGAGGLDEDGGVGCVAGWQLGWRCQDDRWWCGDMGWWCCGMAIDGCGLVSDVICTALAPQEAEESPHASMVNAEPADLTFLWCCLPRDVCNDRSNAAVGDFLGVAW